METVVQRGPWELHYVSLYHLNGISALSDDRDQVIWQSAQASAVLSVNPDALAQFADWSKVITHGMLTGLFRDDPTRSTLARFEDEIRALCQARAQKFPRGVYFAYHASREVDPPTFSAYRRHDHFGIGFDAIDKDSVRNDYRSDMETALASVLLTMQPPADSRVFHVTDAIFFVDPKSGFPHFSVTVSLGEVRIAVNPSFEEGQAEMIARLASNIRANRPMQRVWSLHIASLSRGTDPLQAFMSAWNALEIFTSMVFSATYDEEMKQRLRAAHPPGIHPYFARLEDLAKGRIPLADKFAVIASILSANEAERDTATFRAIKKRRDEILHGVDDTCARLPTEQIQEMSVKYLRLHVQHPGLVE